MTTQGLVASANNGDSDGGADEEVDSTVANMTFVKDVDLSAFGRSMF